MGGGQMIFHFPSVFVKNSGHKRLSKKVNKEDRQDV